jgi:hypothetical protein
MKPNCRIFLFFPLLHRYLQLVTMPTDSWLRFFPVSVWSPDRAAIPVAVHTGTGGPSKKRQKRLRRRLSLDTAAPPTIAKMRFTEVEPSKMRFTELEPSSPIVKDRSPRGPDIELDRPWVVELLPMASNPAISPLPDAGEPQVPLEWGPKLEGYVRLRLPGTKPDGITVDLPDMRALLNTRGSTGWVTNFSMDAFLSTLMPGFNATEKLQLARVFLPAFVSKHVQEYGVLPPSEQTANRVAVLRTAREIYVVYNLGPNEHWAVMRLLRQRKRLEIFDSLQHVNRSHGRQMLDALSEYLHENMDAWLVVVYRGVPQQTDHKSCGVFTCVIAKHLLEDATLPSIQEAIPEWRRWIARALVQGAVW